MGTHPIFESDFDCLTDWSKIRQEKVWTNWTVVRKTIFIMFTDIQLSVICNVGGLLLFMAIIAFHYVNANLDSDGVENKKNFFTKPRKSIKARKTRRSWNPLDRMGTIKVLPIL